MLKKGVVVLYHAECKDGFGGALAAWKKFGDAAAYIPVLYHNPPPTGLQNKEIYFIDFVYKPEVMHKIIKENKRVTAIDHHISGEIATKLTVDYRFAIDHSGCVLAWQYFHPNKKVPKLLSYIEDGDLWRWTVPKSKEVRAYLETESHDFKVWDSIARRLEGANRNKIISEGTFILKLQNQTIEKIIRENATMVEFEGYKVFAVNSPINKSEIGNLLTKQLPPMGIIWNERDGVRSVSLRSTGNFNVSAIAEKYGGGGHKNAAAFSLPATSSHVWKIIK